MTGPNRPGRWRIDMTEQEQLRQLKEEYENMIIPETGRERLQAGIDRARMEKKRAERVRRRSAWTAAAAAVIVFIQRRTFHSYKVVSSSDQEDTLHLLAIVPHDGVSGFLQASYIFDVAGCIRSNSFLNNSRKSY